MKYSQAIILALAAGASVASALPSSSRATRIGRRVGNSVSLAGTFANAARGIAPTTFEGRSLATDLASQDPAAQNQTQTPAQAPSATPNHKKHHKHHKRKGRRKSTSKKAKSKKVAGCHHKATESKATSATIATGPTSTPSTITEATPTPSSTSAASTQAKPVVAREFDEDEESLFIREFEDELEARFFRKMGSAIRGSLRRIRKHDGAEAAARQQPEGRSVDDLEARYPHYGRIGVVVHPHRPVQPVPSLQTRRIYDEDLEMRDFDELEARFPSMRGGVRRFRKHFGGATSGGAPAEGR